MSARGAEEEPHVEAWETSNLHTLATFLATGALRREETRGSHWREDYPDRDDERWAVHLVGTLADGDVRLATLPVAHAEVAS